MLEYGGSKHGDYGSDEYGSGYNEYDTHSIDEDDDDVYSGIDVGDFDWSDLPYEYTFWEVLDQTNYIS